MARASLAAAAAVGALLLAAVEAQTRPPATNVQDREFDSKDLTFASTSALFFALSGSFLVAGFLLRCCCNA